MTDRSQKTDGEPTCGCKLGRVAVEYGLLTLDDDLVVYWSGDGDEQLSTRQLATHVNQQILKTALEETDIVPKDGEVENTYRLLTDDDVSSGTRVQTRNELRRDGVPIDDVESIFDIVNLSVEFRFKTVCQVIGHGLMRDEIRLDDRDGLEERREDATDELTDLRTRIDQIEGDAVEAFNEHMENLLNVLGYGNLDRT